MLRSLKSLKLIKSDLNGLEILMSTQGKMIKLMFDLQALQFEYSIQGSKNMIVLSGHTPAEGSCPRTKWNPIPDDDKHRHDNGNQGAGKNLEPFGLKIYFHALVL